MKLFAVLIVIFQITIFLFQIFKAKTNQLRSDSDVALPLTIKVMLSISCIVLAFVILFFNTKEYYLYSILVFVGMIFSFLGDLAMAKVLKFNNRLIGGMSIFSLAHIFYASAYIKIMIQKGVFKGVFIPIYIIALTLFIIFLSKNLSNEFKGEKAELILGIIYATLILNMAISAAFLVYSLNGQLFLTIIGAIVFIISDGLIALFEFFDKTIPNVGLLIWITYVAAQMCIICSPII